MAPSPTPTPEPEAVEEVETAEEEEIAEPAARPTFASLGIIPPLLTALDRLKFTHPTAIQVESIPYALQGRDIIGVAETVNAFLMECECMG